MTSSTISRRRSAPLGPGTRVLHTGFEVDPHTGAAAIPVHHAAMFDQPGLDRPGAYDYGRSGNPTRGALEGALASLEGGCAAFAFSSGLAAISAVLMTLDAGDHVVVTDDCYGGTYRLLTRVFARLGIRASFVDTSSPAAVEAAFTDRTRLLLVESVSNPFLRVTDVGEMAAIARGRGVRLAVDNTFLSPHLLRPLELGADLVIHSATKYLGGHSDVTAGCVAAKDPAIAAEIGFLQNAVGAVLGPQDCFLLMRGIKTLAVRLDRQGRSARRVAEFLRRHPAVAEVFDPGVGAVVSFRLASEELAAPFVDALELPLLGVSLGAVESLVAIPARHSHASVPAAERARRGITDALVRYSVGIEDPEDLIADLDRALAAAAPDVRARA